MYWQLINRIEWQVTKKMKIESARKWFYPESGFGGFTRLDPAVAFFSRVNALLKKNYTVLDVGCGRGAYGEDVIEYRRDLRILKGKVERVIGIDLDAAGSENPHIDEFRLLDSEIWPVKDNSVDLIVCDFVMEHLEDPPHFFAEASRVVKKGGYLCVRTPNKWSYVATIARIVPNSAHSKIVNKVQLIRKEIDVFPTFYRCNTKSEMKKQMDASGFSPAVYRHEPDPRYFNFSKVLYIFAVLIGKVLPPFMHTALFGFGQKR